MGAAAGTDGTPVRVVVLDDHDLLRRGVRDLLADVEGIEQVGEAGTARRGEVLTLALRPDVLVLDVRLGEDSGVEVCRAVRSRDPGIRVLMLSTYDDPDARLAARLAGASGYLVKQVDGSGLVEAIRRVARGEVLDEGLVEPAAALHGDPRLNTLTNRERLVLDLVVEGLTNIEIAERLGIAPKTVRNHVTTVLSKLGLQRRTQAAVYAVTHLGED